MCGRFCLTSPEAALARLFGAADARVPPRYNIAPGQTVPVMTAEGLVAMRWGLIPSWARDPGAIGTKMINARVETAADKPAFRPAWRRRRCLIPADGFFEWHDRRPFLFRRPDAAPFAFAGLWEVREDLTSFAILTRDADAQVAPYHHRMPVLLVDGFDAWLKGGDDPGRSPVDLTVPSPVDLTVQEIGRRVNSPRHDDPAVIAPVDDRQGRLF